MQMPVSEICDRYTILSLKMERLPPNDQIKGEFDVFREEFHSMPNAPVCELADLYMVNSKIWDLEAEMKAGREDVFTLEEVGRRAIAIRKLNAQRIALKNKIAKTYGGFQEVKGQHASATNDLR